MRKRLTKVDLVNALRKTIEKEGQKKVCNSMGVSQGHMSDLLSGNKKIGEKIANKFGYKQVTYYEVMK